MYAVAFDRTGAPSAAVPPPAPPLDASTPPPVKPFFLREPSRPAALPALYVSFGVVQVLDACTTVAATRAGGRETNPLMAGFAGHPGGLIVFKVATTVGTVYAVETMWRKSRVGVVVLMVALNGVTAAVAAHNQRVARDAGARSR